MSRRRLWDAIALGVRITAQRTLPTLQLQQVAKARWAASAGERDPRPPSAPGRAAG